MPANTAAAPGATDANQPPANGAEAPAGNYSSNGNGASQPHGAPIGDRLPGRELFARLEGIPEEVRQLVEDKDEGGRKKEEVPEVQPSAEQQTQTPPAAAAPSDEDAIELTPEQRRNTDPKLLARIDKLSFQKAELKRQLEAAKQATTAPAATPPAAAPAAPAAVPASHGLPAHVAGLQTPEELQQRAEVARQTLRWAKLHRTGADEVQVRDPETGQMTIRDYTAEQMAEIEVAAEDELTAHLPARFREIQMAHQQQEAARHLAEARPVWEELAREEYPELETEKEGPLAKAVDAILANFPMLQQLPDGRITAADIAKAALARQERLQAKHGTPAAAATPAAAPSPSTRVDPAIAAFLSPKPPRAPAVPRAGSEAPTPPSVDDRAAAAQERYVQTQAPEDYARWIELSKGQPVSAGA